MHGKGLLSGSVLYSSSNIPQDPILLIQVRWSNPLNSYELIRPERAAAQVLCHQPLVSWLHYAHERASDTRPPEACLTGLAHMFQRCMLARKVKITGS